MAGYYYLHDEIYGKPVYKKYGDDMFMYLIAGSAVLIDGLIYDRQKWTHCYAPVFKARDESVFLFFEGHRWNRDTRSYAVGRWILGTEITWWPEEVRFEDTAFLAYTSSSDWREPPSSLRTRDLLQVTVRPEACTWALGESPTGTQHVCTHLDDAGSTDPRGDWGPVNVELMHGRSFKSCVVMAQKINGRVSGGLAFASEADREVA